MLLKCYSQESLESVSNGFKNVMPVAGVANCAFKIAL